MSMITVFISGSRKDQIHDVKIGKETWGPGQNPFGVERTVGSGNQTVIVHYNGSKPPHKEQHDVIADSYTVTVSYSSSAGLDIDWEPNN